MREGCVKSGRPAPASIDFTKVDVVEVPAGAIGDNLQEN